MAEKVSKQVVNIMENLVRTCEMAEETPDFVASAFQTKFDNYADDKLEEAAALIEHIDGGKAAALVRSLKRNHPSRQIVAEIRARMGKG